MGAYLSVEMICGGYGAQHSMDVDGTNGIFIRKVEKYLSVTYWSLFVKKGEKK
jgi:hypothetical protein